ncbi:MAG: hypothetical protein U1E65_36190 [Myxococcota bacterium]
MIGRVVGYAAVMFGASAVTGLLNFLISVTGMVGRSKATYGEYMTYVMVYSTAQSFFMYGINGVVQKLAAGKQEERKIFCGLALRGFALLFTITTLIGLAVGFWWNPNYGLGVAGIALIVMNTWARYLVRTSLDASAEAILLGVPSVATASLQVLFVVLIPLEHGMIYGDFLAMVIAAGLGLWWLPKISGLSFGDLWRLRAPKALKEEALEVGRPLWLAGQIGAAGSYMSGLVTRAGLGAEALAAQGATQTFWQFAWKPIDLVAQGTLPALVDAKEERQRLYFDVLRMGFAVLPSLAVGVAIGMPLLFQVVDLISHALGVGGPSLSEKYGEVNALLLIQAASMPLSAFTMVWNQYSIAVGEAKASLPMQIASASATLVALLALAGPLGLYGVYAAIFVGALASAIAWVALLGKRFPAEMKRGLVWLGVSQLAAGGALGLGAYALHHPYGWALSFLAVLGYLTVLLISGIIRLSDLRQAVAMVRRRFTRGRAA